MVVQGTGAARFLLSEQIVYHERQGADRLCGQHVINMILQKPAIASTDLRKAAEQLDSNESMLMGVNPKQHQSENAGFDGYFNVSVIEVVLMNHKMGMTIVTDKLKNVYANPAEGAEAFLVNFSDHWFCVRKIKGIWYECNSLKDAPEKLTNAVLNQRIKMWRSQGTVFYVYHIDGRSMPIPDDWVQDLNRARSTLASHQKLMDEEERAKLFESGNKGSQQSTNVFSGAGQSLGSSSVPQQTRPVLSASNPPKDVSAMTEEEQLEWAMRMSLENSTKDTPSKGLVDLKEEPSEGCTLAVRVTKGPKAGRHTRRFIPTDPTSQVLAWISQLLEGSAGRLSTAVPPVKSFDITSDDLRRNGLSVLEESISSVLLTVKDSKGESFNLAPC